LKNSSRVSHASSEALGDVRCRKPCICGAGKQRLDLAGVNAGIARYDGQDEPRFSQIETRTVKHTFVLPSFDAYYGPFERGGASTGQALATLSDELRRAVHDEVRRDFGDTSGPIEVEAEYRIASGRR